MMKKMYGIYSEIILWFFCVKYYNTVLFICKITIDNDLLYAFFFIGYFK